MTGGWPSPACTSLTARCGRLRYAAGAVPSVETAEPVLPGAHDLPQGHFTMSVLGRRIEPLGLRGATRQPMIRLAGAGLNRLFTPVGDLDMAQALPITTTVLST